MAQRKRKAEGELAPLGAFELLPLRQMERFFEEMTRPWGWPLRWGAELLPTPAVDIYEEDDEVVLKAELPGLKKEDLEVTITEDTVSISGQKRKEEKVQRKDYFRLERSWGSFSRSFSLPARVQPQKAKARFKDGVLELRVPKTEEAKRKKLKVQIQ